jgi:peptidyl-prolyl cis-trans isomerase A (cyclophilin A)
MRHVPLSLALLAILVLPLCAQEEPAIAEDAPAAEANPVVLIKTSMGDIEVELWPKAAPETVKTFIGLAEGTKEFKDPASGEMVKRPYYDGLNFHRVIKDFMIQGGCPLGTGSGSPGFKFKDEINAKGLGLDKVKVLENGRPTQESAMAVGIRDQRSFQQRVLQPLLTKLGIANQEQFQARQDEVKQAVDNLNCMEALENLGYKYDDTLEAKKPLEGCLAMANSGPNTNGSQFFINLKDTPWLIGKHTVFGKVSKGFDIVQKIGECEVAKPGDKPVTEIKIVSIRLVKSEG